MATFENKGYPGMVLIMHNYSFGIVSMTHKFDLERFYNGELTSLGRFKVHQTHWEKFINGIQSAKPYFFIEQYAEMDEMSKFLMETGGKVHKQLVHAIDFASMGVANSGSRLGRDTYYKTKKDVFEYQRKRASEALRDKTVVKFVKEYGNLLWEWYDGEIEHLQKYVEICTNGGYVPK